MEPRDKQRLKAKFGVSEQRMLLTFGLLGPNKGIETVIRALPAVIAAFPDLVYFVVGATHPTILRRHGEAYRTTLEGEAERLGVRGHVIFRDQFVTTEELCNYLQAADIFVSPYRTRPRLPAGRYPTPWVPVRRRSRPPTGMRRSFSGRGAGLSFRSAIATL